MTRPGVQQCQAKGMVFCSCLGLIQNSIRMCKINGPIQTRVWLLRTPVPIVWATDVPWKLFLGWGRVLVTGELGVEPESILGVMGGSQSLCYPVKIGSAQVLGIWTLDSGLTIKRQCVFCISFLSIKKETRKEWK